MAKCTLGFRALRLEAEQGRRGEALRSMRGPVGSGNGSGFGFFKKLHHIFQNDRTNLHPEQNAQGLVSSTLSPMRVGAAAFRASYSHRAKAGTPS